MFAFILGSLTAGLTAFYSFRLISLVFLSKPNGNKKSYLDTHESDMFIIIPLLILALFSIFFGFIMSDLFVGVGSDFFSNSLFIHPNNISIIEAEFSIHPLIKLIPSILSILGAGLGLLLYNRSTGYRFLVNLTESQLGKKIYGFLNGKYYFDVIYNNYVISKGLHMSYKISKEIDRGAIELLGPYGLSNIISNTGKNISRLDTGIITNYALFITLSLLLLVVYIFYPYIIGYTSLNTNELNNINQLGIIDKQNYSDIFKILTVIMLCSFLLPKNNSLLNKNEEITELNLNEIKTRKK